MRSDFLTTCVAVPAGDSMSLLAGRRGRGIVAVQRRLADALAANTTWHEEDLRAMLCPTATSLEQLVDAGIVHRLVNWACEARPSSVGMVTADRYGECARALSFLSQDVAACSGFGADEPILVVDNSATPRNQRNTLDAVRAVVRRHRRRAVVVSREARVRLVDELTRADAGAGAAARFALLERAPGVTNAGTARNVLHLLTIGRSLVSIDDDITGQVLRPPEVETPMATGSEHLRIQPLSSTDLRQWSGADLVSAHLEWLNRRLGARGEPLAVLTMSGLRGDCGAEGPWRELRSGGGTYPYRLTRRVVRGTRQPTMVDAASSALMTYAYGLANDGALPPFLPVGRNQDGVFGACLALTRNDPTIVHLPIYVRHEPPGGRDERAYRDVGGCATRRGRVNDFIEWIARDVPAGFDAPARLGYVTDRLAEAGRRISAGSYDDLRDHRLWLCASRLEAAARWAQYQGWSAHRRLRRTIRAYASVCANDEEIIPVEWTSVGAEPLGRYLQASAAALARWDQVVRITQTLPRWRSPWTCLAEPDGVHHVEPD